MESQYQPEELEEEVQQRWDQRRAFRAVEDSKRPKFYCLAMFPYPSGRLHMGHVRNYTISDVIARYQRMRGHNVLQPMGWDAFGLPAENAAMENNVPPARWTRENIATMRLQLRRLGFAYDWQRELDTSRPDYYRWEQWLFLRLLKRGLVYRKEAVVNWDPVDQTVLANEQVIEGRGWRSGALVERRQVPQWFLRITAYVEELLAGLDELPGWPEAVRTMQRNWIGRSEGVEVEFEVPEEGQTLTVFTTRPDTLMGVTSLALAAEHPLVLKAARGNARLTAFLEECRRGGMAESTLESMEKKGLPLDYEALHPVSGERLPLWVANFVLMSYGTGAVMSVPAHDQRDWEFATAQDLPVRPVVFPQDGADVDFSRGAYTDPGVLRNSGRFDGLDSKQASARILKHLEQAGKGRCRVNYRLHDWGISRQRYWGCPIPVLYDQEGQVQPVPNGDLPVRLPERLTPDGHRSPLETCEEFLRVDHAGAPARRETDTFDTFFESSWYYARFCCPDNDKAMLDERARYWLPVDQYVGGVEHAVLHLLYARFFHRLLRDEGLVDGDEPFRHLLTQGMVLKDGAKMSKSRGNTVDPDELIRRYGADTVRLYMMFTAPPEQSLEWSDSAVEGASRFLRRLWRRVWEHTGQGAVPSGQGPWNPEQRELRRRIHQTIVKVDDDIGRRYTFNTAIAAVMELLNDLSRFARDSSPAGRALVQEGLETCVLLLSPIVPHVSEILWRELGHTSMIIDAPWPRPDPQSLQREQVELVVQVNGKLRGRIQVSSSAEEEKVRRAALSEPNVQRAVGAAAPTRFIFVPGRLLNIVVAPPREIPKAGETTKE